MYLHTNIYANIISDFPIVKRIYLTYKKKGKILLGRIYHHTGRYVFKIFHLGNTSIHMHSLFLQETGVYKVPSPPP